MKKTLLNYEIAAIAEALFDELSLSESSRSAWAFSLYFVLMKCFGNSIPEPKWEEVHNQWNIDHLYRGATSSKKKRAEIPLYILKSCKKNGPEVTIEGAFSGSRDFKVTINKALFSTLYSGETNRLHLFILEKEVDELLNTLGEINQEETASVESIKIGSLWKIVNGIRLVYSQSGPVEKDYIETTIGAAIFYLPHPVNECFNGYISIKALNDDLKEKHVVKEHLFPRKRAGCKVLMNEFSIKKFECLVKTELRVFMYLTSEENKSTINYEGTHDEVLKKLKIEKFPSRKPSPFLKNHTLYKNFVRWMRAKIGHKELELEDAEKLLNEFLAERNKALS